MINGPGKQAIKTEASEVTILSRRWRRCGRPGAGLGKEEATSLAEGYRRLADIVAVTETER
jgi:hypothetical protein